LICDTIDYTVYFSFRKVWDKYFIVNFYQISGFDKNTKSKG
jgi:hypothetical protein